MKEAAWLFLLLAHTARQRRLSRGDAQSTTRATLADARSGHARAGVHPARVVLERSSARKRTRSRTGTSARVEATRGASSSRSVVASARLAAFRAPPRERGRGSI
eukprot:29835-Pelagococcus_subviridis.AAC.6